MDPTELDNTQIQPEPDNDFLEQLLEDQRQMAEAQAATDEAASPAPVEEVVAAPTEETYGAAGAVGDITRDRTAEEDEQRVAGKGGEVRDVAGALLGAISGDGSGMDNPISSFLENSVTSVTDFIDNTFQGDQKSREDIEGERTALRDEQAESEEKRLKEARGTVSGNIADAVVRGVPGAVLGAAESGLEFAELVGDASKTLASKVNIVGYDPKDDPFSSQYNWVSWNLGKDDIGAQTAGGQIAQGFGEFFVAFGATGGGKATANLFKTGLTGNKTKAILGTMGREALEGVKADLILAASGEGNLSNMIKELAPDWYPTFLTALAVDEDDNPAEALFKTAFEGGLLGAPVGAVGAYFKGARAVNKLKKLKPNATQEELGNAAIEAIQGQLDLGYTPPRPERAVKAYDVAPQVLEGDLSNVSKLDATELAKLDSEYQVSAFTENYDDIVRNADPEAAMEAFGKNITVKELPNGTKIDWIQKDISEEFGEQADISLAQRAEAIEELTEAGGQVDNETIEAYLGNKYGTAAGPLGGQKVVRIDWDSNGGELGTNGTKLYKQFGEVAKEQKPGTIIQAEAAGDGHGIKGQSDAQSRAEQKANVYSERLDPEVKAQINEQASRQYDSIYGAGEWSQLDREARSIHISDMRADDPTFDKLFTDPRAAEVQSVREKLYMRAGLAAPNGEGKMYGIVAYRPDGRRTMVPLDPTKPIQDQVDAAKELPNQGTLNLGDTSAEAGPVPLNRRTSPGKIENDAASGRPGTPEEGGKPPLQDPQDRVFQGRKEVDTNAAAKSFWDDAEPGGGTSIVDELDIQNLQSVDQVKEFISARIPDVDVEDIARRLRRQPTEYTEKVFRSLADFAGSRNYEALEDLRFTNTFDIKGVDAGGAVVLDTLTKSLGDRVSILSREVMELTELDAPFKVQANQILDRAQSMVLLRKESTQFASQNLQNWKDVPNDLKRAVENDRQKIAQLFDELRTDLNSSDVMDIKRAKDRFAKLGIALSSSKGDPVAQMNFWEGLGHSGWNQFENVYINSLLSSPLSHARNIGGNAIAVAERSASRVLGNALTGNFAEAKRGLAAYDAFGSTMSEAWKVARESWGSPYSRVSAGAKVTDRVAARRRELEAIVNSAQNQSEKMAGQMALRAFSLFNNPWFSWPGKGLQAGDDFFKTVLARTELRYQAAVESDSIADGATASARKELREKNYQILVQDKLSANGEILDHDLIKVSQDATFQRDLEGWAAGMSTGLRAMPGGRIIVPFLKTGHNINRYAKELTPLQLLNKEYGQTMKFGTPDEKAIMNGRIALGSSVMGTTAFMAGADLITGVGPLPGPTRDLWLQDHEPMSIKVGNKWVSYQALPGFSLIMSTTADITQMTQKMRDGDVDYVLGAAPFFFTNAISTQPMFQGILDMSEVLDFQNNYTPEKAGEAIAAIANRMGGGEGLRRHMENAISQNMYEYKNWAVAFVGKVTGGIAPSAYDMIMGEDIAKVPEIDVLTGKKKVSKYSNPANSVNPFTVIGKDVSPLVETFQNLDFPINLIVPEKVAGVKLTPDQKKFVQKEVYNDGKMANDFSTTFKGKYFWGKYEEWRQQQKAGIALPKEGSDWYRILARIQQKHKSRAVKELKQGKSEYSVQFRDEYAAKNMENSKAPGVSIEDQSRLRDIQQLTNF